MEQTYNRQTPARRGRGGGRAKGRKTYASEGDVLTDMPTPVGFPATPMKSNNNSPAPGSQPANPKSTTRKSNRKSRPSNVSTSPGPDKSSHRTPPPSASAIVSTSAFASSSSFHSPAPGALPRPGFSKVTKSQSFATSDGHAFLRTRSESVVVQSVKEPSPPASDCDSPIRPKQVDLAQSNAQDSPLEVLFQAQRAEQERIRRANSANAVAELDGPFSAPAGFRQAQHHSLNDQPIPLNLPSRPAPRAGTSDKYGAAGRDVQPAAFSLPIHERMHATRPGGSYLQQSPRYGPRPTTQQDQHLATPPQPDPSEQMKKLLGISGPASTQSSPAPLHGHYNMSPTVFANSVPPSNSPLNKGHTGASNPNGATDLENTLRQALKLPCSMGSGLDSNKSPQSHLGRFSG